MGWFEFPHTRTYDSDLGWIIANMKTNIDAIKWLQRYAETHQPEYEELKQKVDALINGLVDVIEPWDSSAEYPIYSIVSYLGKNYIAIRPVPVGAMITNEYYWQEANTVVEQINAIGQTVVDLGNDLEAFKPLAVNHYVTPQEYGAVGDGVADDTQALQDCIDDCYSKGIYRIFLPRGTYKITEPLRLYFTFAPDYWGGRGITLEGEHQGDTIIQKSGPGAYNGIDTVLYCMSGTENQNSGSAVSVLNMTLENLSTVEDSYCINGEIYCRGRFENLYIKGKKGIKCADGFTNEYNNIIGFVESEFFHDGGTSNVVGKIGCFGVTNPYILRGQYSNYGLLFGDGCKGVFVEARPYGACNIDMIGAESSALDVLLDVPTTPGGVGQNKYVNVGVIQTNNLSTDGAAYVRIGSSKLHIGGIDIIYQQAVGNVTVFKYVGTYGHISCGEVSHFPNATQFDASKVKLQDGVGGRNILLLHNHEMNGYMNESTFSLSKPLGYYSQSENEERKTVPNIVMGGYFNGSGRAYGDSADTLEYLPMLHAGSLFTNNINKSNVAAAGFVSLGAETQSFGTSMNNKAPIPIMYVGTDSTVPSAAKKDGCMLYDTGSNTLKVWYSGAWHTV